MSSIVPDDAPRPRLAHVKKWEGFNGFGFNLHAEKGKAGQFIGKVDPNSPADFAHLKEGDRIVEVNGTNISNENHQQVVQRIKAVSGETKLLVVDKETDDYYKDAKVVVRGDMPNVSIGIAPDNNPAGNHVEVLNNVVRRNSSRSSHSSHESHHSEAAPDSAHPHVIKLCLLRIWPNFQGYGFNLHAEKNKVGQYIGKVDDGSPAQAAGLKEKDRILEVNGDSVVNDNHQAAVIKIKSIPNETRLLVVDPESDEYFKEKGITLGGQVDFIKHLDSGTEVHHSATAGVVHPYKARLVQLETWSDYNGYGFNMHSIKGRTGEYIGKVEAGSPSFVAGLREGDRILEVSRSNIENDTHNDVVGKIKAAGGRALMLVIDADADKYYKEHEIHVDSNMDNVVRINCPDRKPEANGTAEPSTPELKHVVVAAAVVAEAKDEVTLEGEKIADSIMESVQAEERSMEDTSSKHSDDEHRRDSPESIRRDSPRDSPKLERRDSSSSSDSERRVDRDDLNDYEHIDTHRASPIDNNNEAKDHQIINEDVPRVPTPEPVREPEHIVEVKHEPELRRDESLSEPESPNSPVTIAGIEFAASAHEARRRMTGRKKDVRISANLSAKEKYELFQRL